MKTVWIPIAAGLLSGTIVSGTLFFVIGVPILFAVSYGVMHSDGGFWMLAYLLGAWIIVLATIGFVFWKTYRSVAAALARRLDAGTRK